MIKASNKTDLCGKMEGIITGETFFSIYIEECPDCSTTHLSHDIPCNEKLLKMMIGAAFQVHYIKRCYHSENLYFVNGVNHEEKRRDIMRSSDLLSAYKGDSELIEDIFNQLLTLVKVEPLKVSN
ncbi:hypothetical protein A9Q91_03585 [Candidatus Gracilibacteria bacterium 28_42_T64]|nr:hypothetical protein A9Q91_03585 [Candidatus Gracilibacteria bacterium 28_42_T64]